SAAHRAQLPLYEATLPGRCSEWRRSGMGMLQGVPAALLRRIVMAAPHNRSSHLFAVRTMAAFILAWSALGQEAGELPKFDEAVEVTASRSSESVVDAPVAVTVVGQHEIETSPADNCADLLRPVTNVVVTSAR